MTLKWWQTAVFYQIYPRSFADGNGDGIGDFPGMTARLDHLRDLGVDAIWLSPHFPSPFKDCGYDITDYSNVAPEYGSIDDFVAFLDAAHARGIRVILDLVLNHTSDQHPWFVESRSSRDNPRRDWYIWRDGRDGGAPNNWASIFGGSAWTLDPTTGQYYYNVFLKEQPDLNWRNPEVKQAMWDAVRFWLDLGVDGFRLDAIATVFERPDLPDHSYHLSPDQILDANMLDQESYWTLMEHQLRQPGVHELLRELRALIDSYPGERVLIGEDEDVTFHGFDNDELHLVFNFPLLRTERLTAAHIRANQAERLSALPAGAWPCNTLGNHDSPRVLSRFGDGVHDAALARLHAALVLTLKGTPFLYNGEEIGMADLELTSLDQIRDTAASKRYRLQTERQGIPPEQARAAALATTRDRCRSPLQWDSGPNAGFSRAGVDTWLPVHANHAQGVNVADQEADPASILNFYRRLLRVRRASPALSGGEYEAIDTDNDVVAFWRRSADPAQQCLVALSFSATQQTLAIGTGEGQTLFRLGGADDATIDLRSIELPPFDVLIAEVRGSA